MNNNCRQVLVVDDEPKILEVVCMLMESKGFKTFPPKREEGTGNI